MREHLANSPAANKRPGHDYRQMAALLASILFGQDLVPFEVLFADRKFPSDMLPYAADYLRDAGCEIITTAVGMKMIRVGFEFMPVVVRAALAQAGVEMDIKAFATTTSTNDECFSAAAKAVDKPLAIIANMQSNGRGRRGNRWEARAGHCALLSLLLPARELAVETLSLAAGWAVAESVATLTGGNPDLKWPNDVLIDGCKLAGILIETRPNVQHPLLTDYVIGVGVNVMQTDQDFPGSLKSRAISLNMIRHKQWDLTEVIVVLLKNLGIWCNPLRAGEELVPLWLSRCRMLENPVRVSCAGRIIEGTVADIDPLEGLIIRDYHGMNHACLASQTTVLRE